MKDFIKSGSKPKAPMDTSQTFKRVEKSLVKQKAKPVFEDPFEDFDEDTLKELNSLPIDEEPVAKKSKNLVISSDDDDDKQPVAASKPKTPIKSVKQPEKPIALNKTAEPVKKIEPISSVASSKKVETVVSSPSKPVSVDFSPAKPKVEAKKFNYRDYMQKKASVPINYGAKQIPEGKENCFSGLTFVFTGELSSLARDQAQDIVKRYGGRVTSAPSSKTSYVVVGQDAGPKKLEKIEDLKLKTLDEDQFLALILERSDAMPDQEPEPVEQVPTPKKQKTSDSPLKKQIEAIPSKPSAIVSDDKDKVLPESTELWVEKYRPKRLEEFIGNTGMLSKLGEWLSHWSPEKESMRAALISGPPGIGKTTAALMISKMYNFEPIEFNASDTRSKKALQDEVKILVGNRSLDEYSNMFSSSKAVKQDKKAVLIMDEVDGMSSGDRGGMAELIQLIKKSKIPIICICNDRNSPKVRSLANHCLDLRFRRSEARQVAARINQICQLEGLTVKPNTVEELCTASQGDIRQILNTLSSWRKTKTTMDFDQAKQASKESQKDTEVGLFEAIPELLGGYFRSNLNHKIDLYFSDSSFVPLMVQENYLKCNPSLYQRTEKLSKKSTLEIFSLAADSISDSDIVDRMIHGSTQEWGLAPFHGVMSCVLPGFLVNGGVSRVDFSIWLGQNSKTNKTLRMLNEISIHSSLVSKASRFDFRLQVGPVLFKSLMLCLEKGVDGIDSAIEILDCYNLLKEDFDSLTEILLDGESMFSKIPTAVKSAFTRKYNKENHMLPYSIDAVKAASKASASAAVIEVEEEDAPVEEEPAEEDLTKDKMIKLKPAKAAAKGKATKK